jgi:hypothetical protein
MLFYNVCCHAACVEEVMAQGLIDCSNPDPATDVLTRFQLDKLIKTTIHFLRMCVLSPCSLYGRGHGPRPH